MRQRSLFQRSFTLLMITISISIAVSTVFAQTSRFTYQGRLTDGGTVANGNYDLQFALWDSLSDGGQVGSTQTLNTVAVSNGVFAVSLDFGPNAFNGANRFLEIRARPSGGASFTLLSPRQQITSTPYAVRSLNASSADSVPASGVSAGSGNYIQNTFLPQSGNFNISGNGTVGGTFSGNIVNGNIVNAATQFNLGNTRILGTGFGTADLFVGAFAGQSQLGTNSNTFVGSAAGIDNTVGGFNVFFGSSAGFRNTAGNFNTFVGARTNIIGESTAPQRITLLGSEATVRTGPIFNPVNATAIGAFAQVDQSNSLVLGSINGINGATADTKVGIGTTGPLDRLHVVGDIRVGVTGTNGCVKNNNGGTIAGTCSSDLRFKRNIAPFEPVLNKVTRLQPKYYFWRAEEFPDKNFGAARETGLVAQEVEQVLPELISEDDQGYKLVDYSKLPLMLLQAIKEQQQQIEMLKAANNSLNARLRRVEKRSRRSIAVRTR